MQSNKLLLKKIEGANSKKTNSSSLNGREKIQQICPAGLMNTLLKSKQQQVRQARQISLLQDGKMKNIVEMANDIQVHKQNNNSIDQQSQFLHNKFSQMHQVQKQNNCSNDPQSQSFRNIFPQIHQAQKHKNASNDQQPQSFRKNIPQMHQETLNSGISIESNLKQNAQASQPQAKQKTYTNTIEPQIGPNQGLQCGNNADSNVSKTGQHKSTLFAAGSYGSFLLLKQQKEESMRPQERERMMHLINETHSSEVRSSSDMIYRTSDDNLDNSVLDLCSNDNLEPEPTSRPPKKPNKRGLTMMRDVQTRCLDERKVIILNEKNQLVGPDADTMKEFSNFLGTVARKENLAPLNYISWNKVPNKQQIWEFVNTKYIVLEDGRKWVLKSVRDSWRTYKHRVKQNFFEAYETDKERKENRPALISEEVFESLLAFWNLEIVQIQAKVNKINRGKLTDNHTTGPTSFARVYHEIEKERGNDEPLSLAEMFKATRKRKQGHVYKESDQGLSDKIARIEELQSQGDGGNSESVAEIARKFVKPQTGRVCLFGIGVTPTDLQRNGLLQKPSLKVPAECVESIKASLEQEMQKQFSTEKALMDQKLEKLSAEKSASEQKLEEKLELQNIAWQNKLTAMMKALGVTFIED